jgi:patatin-like phospholipase/acyl hydrolase
MPVKFGLTLAVLTTFAAPAFAQDCQLPIPPAAPNGHTISQQDLSAAVSDAKNYIAQSDVYQQCLLDYVQAQKTQAIEDKKTFDPYIETSTQKKIDDNQRTKVRVGSEINAAVSDFKMAHPN